MSNPKQTELIEELPDKLPILPLRNSVLFPGSIIPIDVGRRKSVRLVEESIAQERPIIGILTQRVASVDSPGATVLRDGTATIGVRTRPLPTGVPAARCRGRPAGGPR